MTDNHIKDLRILAGLTQLQLSEAAGINPRQLRKLESGEIRPENMTLGNALRLAQALGVRPEDLLN